MNRAINIGIVGCGPRGLAALEALLLEAVKYTALPKLKIVIFDDAEYLGAGAVWNPNQSDANWINISLRGLEELSGREPLIYEDTYLPSFPKFTIWLEQNYSEVTTPYEDKFPNRSIMGMYLNKRFMTIIEAFKDTNLIAIEKLSVERLHIRGKDIHIKDGEQVDYRFDECLLTVGHQTTVLDDQMKSWKKHASQNKCLLYTSPYFNNFLEEIDTTANVAIRGLGLSCIDVIRRLSTDLGASFKKNENSHFLSYVPSAKSPSKIAPFSLDGLVCAPKPLNMQVDQFFKPSKHEEETFINQIQFNLKNNLENFTSELLVEIFAEIFSGRFLSFYKLSQTELANLTKNWLIDPSIKHELILEADMGPITYMSDLCEMSLGISPPSLDYTIGQYWRWLQPSMYKIFSHCALPDKTMTEVTNLDEQTKRYSYGPPVESILQLIAMAEDGILDLSFCNNPEIELTSKGWLFTNDQNEVECSIVINSVLSSPKVMAIESGPLKNLIEEKDLNIVSSDLGFSTSTDGLLMSDNADLPSITLLGRNAKGSVLGVDAILECFGPRIDDWAIGLCKRLFEGRHSI